MANTTPSSTARDELREGAIPVPDATGESAMTTMNTTMKTLTAIALAAAALTATTGPSQALGRIFHGPVVASFPGHGPVVTSGLHHVGPISCLACRLPRPYRPPHPIWGRGNHWGHWSHYRRHPVVYGGAPIGPVAAAPAVATMSGPSAAPQAPTGACNCLTKQELPNGGVLFADVCTQQSAIAPPQAVSAR
jgi:hypothetical protein